MSDATPPEIGYDVAGMSLRIEPREAGWQAYVGGSGVGFAPDLDAVKARAFAFITVQVAEEMARLTTRLAELETFAAEVAADPGGWVEAHRVPLDDLIAESKKMDREYYRWHYSERRPGSRTTALVAYRDHLGDGC